MTRRRPFRRCLTSACAWGWLTLAPALAAQSAAPSPQGGGGGLGPVFPAATTALRPDSVLTPPGGPRLLRLSAPGSGLTALRLSIPVQEGPVEAGAAQILATLGLYRARVAAAAIGARVEGSRTPWGIVYTAVGASEDFDYLAYVLREAVAEPRLERVEFERARSSVRGEAQRLRETASGRVATDLLASVIPGFMPPVGTPESVNGLTASAVRQLWSRTHRRENMALVLVGPEPLELVLASFVDVGSGQRGRAFAPTAPAPAGRRERVEMLRDWYGQAWVAGDARNPEGAVVAVLIASRLREVQPAFESSVQLWEVGNARVLAVTGATYPAGGPGMRRRLQGILDETAARVGREEVSPAVARLRLEMLSSARTPWGLAGLVGRYHDATGDPDAVYQHILALDRLTADAIRLYLQDLQRRGPARAEQRP